VARAMTNEIPNRGTLSNSTEYPMLFFPNDVAFRPLWVCRVVIRWGRGDRSSGVVESEVRHTVVQEDGENLLRGKIFHRPPGVVLLVENREL
jgi:hypothetical protein